MARPGFVLEVDDRTPPLLVPDGPRVRLERFPLGTEVLYPAEPLPAVDDLVAAIDAALSAPIDSRPLADQLRPGLKLTIVFDSVTAAPALRTPDVRGRIIERVLVQAAAAGVDDVQLICATGLNRRNTQGELRQLLGERVFRSFYADGNLINHDALDRDRLTVLRPAEGSQPEGQYEIAVNSRLAESDLVVAVHLAHDLGQGGLTGSGLGMLSTGLTSLETIRAVRGHGAPPARADEVGAAITDAVPVFAVEAVLDNISYPPALDFLATREWEWTLKSQAKLLALRGATALPSRYSLLINDRLESGYRVTAVNAGSPAPVAAAGRARVLEQQQVEVSGQADVLVLGVPAVTPYSIGSVTDPVLAAWHALGVGCNSVTGDPLVRPGGAVVVYHPLAQEFSTLQHPATVDFFADVLPTTTDAAELADRFESKFADDPWYSQLYRTSQAFHGLLPFHLWYQLAPAAEQAGDVIFVGADRGSASRLGFRAASTLADALEIASATVGRTPRIRYLHTPPALLGSVT